MAQGKGLLGALSGKGGGRRRFAGWVRVDSDNVIRGWASDPDDLSARADVEIRIDGEVVGRARADRLDPQLVGAQPGDARYGFALLIPARFRDGKIHRFEALVPETGSKLMSKAETFTVGRGASEPRLTITALDPSGATGLMRGGQYAPDVQLDLWNGELFDGTVTTWRRRGPDSEFRIEWPPAAFGSLVGGVVAAPGMVEAGLGGAPIFEGVKLTARPAPEDRVEARIEGRIDLPAGTASVRLRKGIDGQPVAEAPLDRRRALIEASGHKPGDLWAELVVGGQAVAGVTAPVDPTPPPLLVNSGFRRWRDGLPAGWSSDVAPERISRGYFAFPKTAQYWAPGDLVRFDIQPGEAPVLLSQQVAAPPAAAEGVLAFVARASAAVQLEARLVSADGSVARAAPVLPVKPWAWNGAWERLDLSDASGARVELVLAAAPDEPITVEVAGLRLGGREYEHDEAAEAPPGLPGNLVENGALLDWPRGLIVEAGPGRAETAGGWFVQNRGGSAPLRAIAAPLPDASGASLTLAADEVGDYVRLEARLHPDTLKAGPRLRLGFDASLPAGAPGGFQGRTPFVVINRVFLLRYAPRETATGTGKTLAAEVLANVARKVLVGRDPKRFEFDVELDGAAAQADGELFLAFDFKRAFRITLQDVRLASATAAADAAPDLALEDPAIAAQAPVIRGLAGWLSPEVVTPDLRFAPEAERADPPALRWSWAPAAQGSVEVVVTVHDAAEETLDCLRALAGASGVPHTVRIVDDGSGADTRARILDLIADKPWMSLLSLERNLGYTAAANRGIRASDADWVVLLNSDTVVTPGWLEGLLEAAASDPKVALVGPVSNAASFQSVPELKDRRGTWKVNPLPPGWTPARMAAFVSERSEKAFPHAPLLNGFCLMIRRDAFLELGGFNEAAFPEGYGEENDLCVRAGAAGWKLAVADHVYVYHSKSASFGAARRAALQKAAGEALARLHPGVDFTALGDRFREIPALARLRDEVRALYEAIG